MLLVSLTIHYLGEDGPHERVQHRLRALLEQRALAGAVLLQLLPVRREIESGKMSCVAVLPSCESTRCTHLMGSPCKALSASFTKKHSIGCGRESLGSE